MAMPVRLSVCKWVHGVTLIDAGVELGRTTSAVVGQIGGASISALLGLDHLCVTTAAAGVRQPQQSRMNQPLPVEVETALRSFRRICMCSSLTTQTYQNISSSSKMSGLKGCAESAQEISLRDLS